MTQAEQAGGGLSIEGGTALVNGQFIETTAPSARRIDADGLLVLPGIVDIHGDAFERQMMPRQNVHFPLDIALLESDRQAVANGITTVFHGVTWSWEPGLRGPDNARGILEAVERLRPELAADTRVHLRHETYNLDAEEEITGWLAERRVDVLAFNDHMSSIAQAADRPDSLARMVERTGLSGEEFADLVDRVRRRGNEVPASVERLAQAAVAHGVPLLSHDDTTPEQRSWYRSLGCRVAEFPTTLETAEAAVEGGDDIVFGAPNVVRGKSHTGWTSATDMVARGLCSVLASDYYYPAPLLAPFRLAAKGVTSLAKAWALVSEAPAKAVGLCDRGRIASGRRGDLILVDATNGQWPRLVATLVGGRVVDMRETERLWPA